MTADEVTICRLRVQLARRELCELGTYVKDLRGTQLMKNVADGLYEVEKHVKKLAGRPQP